MASKIPPGIESASNPPAGNLSGRGPIPYTLDVARLVTLPPNCQDPDSCLGPTDVIDSDQPAIVSLAQALISGQSDPWSRARLLFETVRDRIRYDITPSLGDRRAWLASSTLERRRGFCQQKAVLLAALGRAAGIPTSLCYAHIRDHEIGRSRYGDLLQGGVILFHGYNAMWIDGAWWTVDATLDADLCRSSGYRLVTWEPQSEARMATTTESGKSHVEVLQELGRFADLPPSISDLALRLSPTWSAMKSMRTTTPLF